MAAVWPLTLPQVPLFDGYSNPYPSRLLTYSMDSGDDKVRPRGPKPSTAEVRYVMTPAQVAILETFASETIAHGAIWFDWSHPTLGRYVRARISPTSDSLFTMAPLDKTQDWLIGMTIKYWPDAPLT